MGNIGTEVLSSRPTSLIYNADDTSGVSSIGAYPRPGPNQPDPEILNFPTSRAVPDGWSRGHLAELNIHFSSAPLSGISLAEVFQRGRDNHSRGIVLTYQNGAQRALGDCRLGVDPSRRYINPVFMCAAPESQPDPIFDWSYRYVSVEFHGEGTHEHSEAGWECFKLEMDGTLNFWFTHKQQYLEVVPDQALAEHK